MCSYYPRVLISANSAMKAKSLNVAKITVPPRISSWGLESMSFPIPHFLLLIVECVYHCVIVVLAVKLLLVSIVLSS